MAYNPKRIRTDAPSFFLSSVDPDKVATGHVITTPLGDAEILLSRTELYGFCEVLDMHPEACEPLRERIIELEQEVSSLKAELQQRNLDAELVEAGKELFGHLNANRELVGKFGPAHPVPAPV